MKPVAPMAGEAPKFISSGIEPIDSLLGGLRSAHLYLAHGDEVSCSLLAVRFAIEGLRCSEHTAMVISSSPEDTVQQFAHLGYDCLEDVYSGRLVVLEYSADIIEQITRISALAPALKELEWQFGETRPRRIVFDTVDQLLAGKEGDPSSRAKEVASWARQFGATLLVVVGSQSAEIVESFNPLVEESFRFDLKEEGENKVRYITFEKNDSTPSSRVDVDPRRGIFLVENISKDDSVKAATTGQTDESISQSEWPGEVLNRPPFYLRLPFDLLDEAEAEISLADVFDPVTNSAQSEMVSSNSTDESAINASVISEPAVSSEIGLDWIDQLVKELEADLPPDDEGALAASGIYSDTKSASSSPPVLRNVNDITEPVAGGAHISSMTAEDLYSASYGTEPSIAEIIARRAKDRSDSDRSDSDQSAVNPNLSYLPEVDPSRFTVLLIHSDPAECESMAESLNQYNIEIAHDGVSALARLISLRPDLIVLSLDLPIIDGFELLSHIRRSLNVPVIATSATRLRAGDRILATEMGADYYLTRPHSSKELKHKARQLIARYRGVDAWIVTSHTSVSERVSHRQNDFVVDLPRVSEKGLFLPYETFSAEVESRVEKAMKNGPAISIVGCRLPQMTAEGGRLALQLFDLMRSTVRDTDRISSNQKNDLVILLPDANSAGGQAFAKRLRERVRASLNQEISIWLRSFPESPQEEPPIPSDIKPSNGHRHSRRAGDKRAMSRS